MFQDVSAVQYHENAPAVQQGDNAPAVQHNVPVPEEDGLELELNVCTLHFSVFVYLLMTLKGTYKWENSFPKSNTVLSMSLDYHIL